MPGNHQSGRPEFAQDAELRSTALVSSHNSVYLVATHHLSNTPVCRPRSYAMRFQSACLRTSPSLARTSGYWLIDSVTSAPSGILPSTCPCRYPSSGSRCSKPRGLSVVGTTTCTSKAPVHKSLRTHARSVSHSSAYLATRCLAIRSALTRTCTHAVNHPR